MISVRELVKRHGTLDVIKGISLTVQKGTVVAMIGPSGGGKSTFLRCINGLEVFQGGEIQIDNLTLRAGPQDPRLLETVRRRVGMVFQQFNLFPHMNVLENCIEAPMQVLGQSRDQAVSTARELLDRVGLSTKIDVLPRSLSGGQQQRVAIARALCMKPEAILFDEPTSALDPVMANEVLAVMTDLAKQGQTMIVVTHSMHFAKNVSTDVYVFAGGHVVESGHPDALFGAPKHETTRSFLREAETA
jgi:ABC-type polar amino acid transport system ATPase subunit